MENKQITDDIAYINGTNTTKIIKSGFLSKRSKYLKIWKK